MLPRACATFLRGRDYSSGNLPSSFTFIENFLSSSEQKILLRVALQQLDARESSRSRRRRRLAPVRTEQSDRISDMFLPDDYYEFEEGHFDGVIRHFREMHLTSWPQDVLGLTAILDRVRSLLPHHQDIQTHLLHLASNGQILPHIDNTNASGTWIFGISLGAERILRMTAPDDVDSFEVLLPSGSVYLQKDNLRYNYRHSILENGFYQDRNIVGGQRLSIMIRDRKSFHH